MRKLFTNIIQVCCCKAIVLWLSLFMVSTMLNAQFMQNWDNLYGSAGFDEIQEVIEVADGYIFAGSASAITPGDPPPTYGDGDYWLFKTDFNGNIIWSYVYGGLSAEILQDAFPTSDGGVVLAGLTESGVGGLKTSGNNGGRDVWIVKVDANGIFEWENSFGGDQEDYCTQILQASDGSYIFGGWTESSISGDVSEASRGGRFDYWVVRLNASGTLLWDKRYGGDDDDLMQSMLEDANGDIILAGLSRSDISGEKSEMSFGSTDYWIVKIDLNNQVIWDRTYGGMWDEEARAVKQVASGVVYIGGYSSSPVGGNKLSPNLGSRDYWMIGIDNNGNKIADRSYGGAGREDLRSIECLPKGQIVLGGHSNSDIGLDKSENSRGNLDYWTLILDSNLDPIWDKTLGGDSEENFQIVKRVSDGGLILGGFTLSNTSGDISDSSNGFQDGWVVKMDCSLSTYLDIGNDTIVCQFQTVDLSAETGLDYICDYLWSDGYTEADRTVWIENDITYSVTVTDSYGCTAVDEIEITTLPAPEFDLGDLFAPYCDGDTLTIGTNVSGSGLVYEWNTGEMINVISLSEPGVYELTVTNSIGCSFADTLIAVEFQLPIIDLGPDQFICEGETATISTLHPGPDYNWSVAGTTNMIDVLAEGEYFLTVTDDNSCSAIDSVEVSFFPELVLDLGSDTTICRDEVLNLDATIPSCPGCTYLWENDSVDPLRFVSPAASSIYQVTVTDPNSCSVVDEISVTIQQLPEIMLAEDDSICQGDSFEIIFSISGAGPFDVRLSFDGRDTILQDISSPHTMLVSPSQTTVYTFLSVVDGTANACSNNNISAQILTVYEEYEFTFEEEICEGDSLFLAGEYQYESGTYTDSLLSIENCDSVLITTLMVWPNNEEVFEMGTCNPLEAGADTIFLMNQYGCDSLVITNTELLPSFIMVNSETTCDGSLVGSDTLFFTNQYGCDSLIVTDILPLPNHTNFFTDITCDIDQESPDTLFNTNQYGCDSLTITTYTYIPPDTLRIADENCDPALTGIDTSYFSNQFGCDSVVIVNTILLPSDTLESSLITCVSSEVGSDTIPFINQYGCESLMITNYVLAFSDTVRVTDTDCLLQNIGIDTTIYSSTIGCDSVVITNTVFVESDTIYSGEITCDINHVPIDTIDYIDIGGCDSIVITSYTYLAPETFIIDEFTCDINQIIPDTLTEANVYGCDSTTITNYFYVPPDTTRLEDYTCFPEMEGINTNILSNQYGCDSVILTDFILRRRDTMMFEDFVCNSPSYSDTLFLMNEFGCDSLRITNYTSITTEPTFLQENTCDPDGEALLTDIYTDQYGCDSFVITQIFYSEPDSIYLFETSCDPSDVGLSIEVLSNQLGCDSLIFLQTDYTKADSIYFYNNSCLVSDTVLNLIPLVNQYGCDSLIFNYTVPGLDSTFILDFTCDPQLAFLDTMIFADGEGCDSIVINGLLLNDSYENVIVNQSCFEEELGSDTLFLSSVEGCDSLIITQTILDSFILSVEPIIPLCYDPNGNMLELSAEGGSEPYLFSVNGDVFSSQNNYSDLEDGSYELVAQDVNGCEDFVYISLVQDIGTQINLEPNIIVNFGEQVELIPEIIGEMSSFYWEGAQPFICEDCMNQSFVPTSTMTVSLVVTDDKGCETRAQVIVIVQRNNNIYVPTAFSPNEDSINDFFMIYGSEQVKKVSGLHIYDRWGNCLFYKEVLDLNDELSGWDGNFKGNKMQPGVFVYSFDVEYFDGLIETIKGEFTLIR